VHRVREFRLLCPEEWRAAVSGAANIGIGMRLCRRRHLFCDFRVPHLQKRFCGNRRGTLLVRVYPIAPASEQYRSRTNLDLSGVSEQLTRSSHGKRLSIMGRQPGVGSLSKSRDGPRHSLQGRDNRLLHRFLLRPGCGDGAGGVTSIGLNAWVSQASIITDCREPL
jgi:hypothetical protein